MVERQTGHEKVLLVGIYHGRGAREEAEGALDELALLTQTAGGKVVARLLQERRGSDPRTLVGKGKADEIGLVGRERGTDLVIFDEDLSPAQARNLEDLTGVRVIDRSQLILDIFAQGARTAVAKAQVELAQLEYTLPRLTGMWEHLSRTGGGIGTRGPGETQLEVDRRRIRRRIFTLRKALKKIEQDRMVRTAKSRDALRASIVGYTNTGKSTLFNHLTRAHVATGNKLFETLDTTTRLLKLPSKEALLVSDTVGFIRKLPHHLVASFHATLESVIEADAVIHVADLSHPDLESQIETVRNVLGEIGAGKKPEILVFNKADLVRDESVARAARRTHQGSILTSALRGWGIEELKERLLEFALKDKLEVALALPDTDGNVLPYVRRYGTILGTETVRGKTLLRIRIPRRYLKPLEEYIEHEALKA